MKIKSNYFLMAVVLVLAFTACGGGGGGGGITAKIKFTNSGSALPSTSMLPLGAKAVGGPALAVTAPNPPFDAYTTFYSSTLGGDTKKVRSITPGTFKLSVQNFSVYSNDWQSRAPLINNGRKVDFAQDVTIAPGTVEAATFHMVGLWVESGSSFGFGGPYGPVPHADTAITSTVSFTWPSEAGDFSTNVQMTNCQAQKHGNIVFVPFGALLPGYNKGAINMTSPASNVGTWIIAGGSGRKLLHSDTEDTVSPTDIVAGFPHYETYIDVEGDAFVVPFTPVTIPESASAVRIEVGWDLDGIIEQYAGATDSTADDIFVLANGWWEKLSMAGHIE
ncbi:hypothetical protein FACS189468_6190 [Spirochaetia bacterium]|nr:hypothetical protein FACS189468_6190 [Spirochaetia bacterium]